MRKTDQTFDARPDPAAPLDFANQPLLHEHILRVSDNYAAHIAISGVHKRLTYAELSAHARQFRDSLRASGLEPGAVVALIARRDVSIVWALLGTIMAGGAFVILDRTWPKDRLDLLVEIARPHVIVDLTNDPVTLLGNAIGVAPRRLELPSVEAAAAYIAFTSGTSGRPKAIVASHDPIVHFIRWYVERFSLRPADRFGLLSGLGHDPALRDIFVPLWLGASLHVPPTDLLASPHALVTWIAGTGLTVLHLTPQLARLITSGAAEAKLESIRLLVLAGAPIRAPLFRSLREVMPNAEIVNGYGTTETPQVVAYSLLSEDKVSQSADQSLPVGKGIDDVQLLVVNGEGRLAEVGERGEIWVRTPYLASGYLEPETRTDGSFTSNPFCEDRLDTVYRTGDLGHYLGSGDVVISGRGDRQIKVNGYRVELEEIEKVAVGCVGITDALVTVVPASGEDVSLACTVVARYPGNAASVALREHLRRHLPAYMVPGSIHALEEWPLTPNGKVDQEKVQELSLAALACASLTGPSDSILTQVHRAWVKVLGHDPQSLDADFWDIGGTSLRAARVAVAIGEELSISLSGIALESHRTVRALAAHVAGLVAEAQAEDERLERELARLLQEDPAAAMALFGAMDD